jgi:protein TonB
VKPRHKEPERLKIAKKNKKPEPPPQLEPEPFSPESETGPETATTERANPQTGIAAGAAGGEAGGVIGGVKGGVSGGVVGGQGTGPLPVSQVANPPVLISRTLPQYPRQARLQSIEGLVLLEAILDREGYIEKDIKVLQSIPLLDEAAIEALRRWRFRPARDHKLQPVRVILEVPIRFVLK